MDCGWVDWLGATWRGECNSEGMFTKSGAFQGIQWSIKNVKVTDIQLAILIFMLNFISEPTDQSSMAHTFHLINSKRNGFIDEAQLKGSLIRLLGYSPKQAQQVARELMIAIDINASGDITYSGTD